MATGGNFVGHLEARAFERAALLARQFEVLAQPLGFDFERGRLLLDLVEFLAQRLVGGARFLQHAGQAERLRLFLLERTQGGVERDDQLVEGLLEFVELADLASGVGQQIAQRFVFLADAGADVGESLDVDVATAAIAVSRPRPIVGAAPLRPNKSDSFAITTASHPDATEMPARNNYV